MAEYDYDLFTIGAGSGGVRASRMAATYGAHVAVAEEKRLGGTCVNVGCIPKKLMVYASHAAEELEQAMGFGWSVGECAFDWATFIERKDAEIARLNAVYERMLVSAGVEVIAGHARVVGPHTVEVAGLQMTARHILVATGGEPIRLHAPGGEIGLISDDIFSLERQPERVLIIGGGYVAVEFAGIFRGLGSEVTISCRASQILRGFDDDVRAFLAREMEKKGINLVLDATVDCLERTSGGVACVLSTGEILEVDAVLYAIGRKPSIDGLGLSDVGVKLDGEGAIEVNELSQTSVDHIHAIGDVTNRLALTPVALMEGNAIARTLFAGAATAVDYTSVPTAVFSQPPLATVGLTEAHARAEYGSIDVYTSEFRPLKHTISGSTERTFMKLVVERRSERILGAHMVGADAPEVIQGLAVALKCGVTKTQLDSTIGIHPTAAEEFVTMRTKRPSLSRPPSA